MRKISGGRAEKWLNKQFFIPKDQDRIALSTDGEYLKIMMLDEHLY